MIGAGYSPLSYRIWRSCPPSPSVRCAAQVVERGIAFEQGHSFYRPQSVFSRDMATLSLQLHRQAQAGHPAAGPLSVLDLMAGAGIRSQRYLQHGQADMVWCNDCSLDSHEVLLANLAASVAEAAPDGQCSPPAETTIPLLEQPVWEWHLPPNAAGGNSGGSTPVVRLTHEEGSRLMMNCVLRRQFFDLIDIDSFGGDSFIGLALGALRYGGLLCLTSTAGPVAGGRDPLGAVSLYSTHLSPVPHANEQGLRMLLGLACREALARGLQLRPLWSLYSPHGPVFRVMVTVDKGGGRGDMLRMQRQLGFVLHDSVTGEPQALGWDSLGSLHRDPQQPPLSMSGPLWVGPLQDGTHLEQMLQLAEERGWAGRDGVALPWTKKGGVRSLGELLSLLVAESDGRLPPWYFLMNDVAKYGGLPRPPARDKLLAALRSRGFAASPTHIDSQAIRTDASLAEVVSTWVAATEAGS